MKDLRDLKDFDDTRCTTYRQRINYRTPTPAHFTSRTISSASQQTEVDTCRSLIHEGTPD